MAVSPDRICQENPITVRPRRHMLAPGEPDLDGYLADSLSALMVGSPGAALA
jgi:hypothetical protein